MSRIPLVFGFAFALVGGLSFSAVGAGNDIALTHDPATGSLAGTVDVGGMPCRVAVVATNRDRKFDGFVYDRDGDGKLQPGETVPLTRILEFKGAYYEFEPGADGKSARLKPVEQPKLGSIEVTCKDAVLTLVSADCAVLVNASEGKRQLLAGQYKVTALSLMRKDKDGTAWELIAKPGTGPPLQKIEIKEGEAATLDLGTPLVVSVKAVLRDGAFSVGDPLTLGQAGEVYQEGLWKNGKKEAIRLQMALLDREEQVLAQATRVFRTVRTGGG